MVEGIVKGFKITEKYPGWWILELEGGEAFLVHNNWVISNGRLKPGDRITFERAKPVYSSCEYGFVENLKKVVEAVVKGAVAL